MFSIVPLFLKHSVGEMFIHLLQVYSLILHHSPFSSFVKEVLYIEHECSNEST